MESEREPDDPSPCPKDEVHARSAYRRHLPHHVPPGIPIFLTWNLKGSVPRRVRIELEQQRKRLEREPRRTGESEPARSMRHDRWLFARRDKYLDTTRDGPMYLKDPRAASVVIASILWGVPGRYGVWAFVVMANHVHLLMTPHVALETITQGIKGYTAHRINTLLDRRGRTFWQDESYDHWVRDEEELHRIVAYIEDNPSTAQLCARPEDWPWSSVAHRRRLGWQPGQTFQEPWKETVLAWNRHRTSGFPA